MTTNQPPTVEERLSRLESVFSNMGETILAQNNAIAALGTRVDQTTRNVDILRESLLVVNQKVDDQSATIDVLVSNIQQLTERVDTLTVNVDRVTNRVDALTANVDRVTNRVDILASEAAQDRQQAAIDRQQAVIDRQEIRRIWEYLRDRNGGSLPPQAN